MNAFNAILLVIVALPAVIVTYYGFTNCGNDNGVCDILLQQPLLYTNLVFMINVNILFWLIALYQNSTWLIDPYWTFIPVLISLYYQFHPFSESYSYQRSNNIFILMIIWSIRLTYSYFRRENWICGEREDWRFADMRKTYGKHWWWLSFFLVYISQQLMLVGITLPLYAIHYPKINHEWNYIDEIMRICCIISILIAYAADNQLRSFTLQKPKRQYILNTGLWKWSRHPNYVGEQLWWWFLCIWAYLTSGHAWIFIGPIFNTVCMREVTKLTEERTAKNRKKQKKLKDWNDYKNKTSEWIPFCGSADIQVVVAIILSLYIYYYN